MKKILIPEYYNRFSEYVRYGLFSGILTGILAGILVTILAFISTSYETQSTIFDASFRTSFFISYFFIHVISFIVWMGIFLSVTGMSIPETKKRVQQSKLFFTNAFVAAFSYIATHIVIIVILFLLAILISFL